VVARVRITERLLLQVVDGRGLSIVDESSGVELVLDPLEAGRLYVGIGWFADHGRDLIRVALRQAIDDVTVILDTERRIADS
jgi:hypothetical protein